MARAPCSAQSPVKKVTERASRWRPRIFLAARRPVARRIRRRHGNARPAPRPRPCSARDLVRPGWATPPRGLVDGMNHAFRRGVWSGGLAFPPRPAGGWAYGRRQPGRSRPATPGSRPRRRRGDLGRWHWRAVAAGERGPGPTKVELSSDARFLTAWTDGAIGVWDVATGAPLGSLLYSVRPRGARPCAGVWRAMGAARAAGTAALDSGLCCPHSRSELCSLWSLELWALRFGGGSPEGGVRSEVVMPPNEEGEGFTRVSMSLGCGRLSQRRSTPAHWCKD